MWLVSLILWRAGVSFAIIHLSVSLPFEVDPSRRHEPPFALRLHSLAVAVRLALDERGAAVWTEAGAVWRLLGGGWLFGCHG